MTTPISNNKLPFWTPVVNWKAPSTFSNLLIQLGIFADQYAYLGNQEIHLHARRVTDEKVYFATEKESKSSLARIIFKVSTFVLSFFILPAIPK